MGKAVDYFTASQLVEKLKALSSPEHVAGMRQFGINDHNTLGVSIPNTRCLVRGRRDHQLALELWATGYYEARILDAYVDDLAQVTPEQMDAWSADFDSWDVCDQVCVALFGKTPYAVKKAKEWSVRQEEFFKRAGFATMGAMAWQNKATPDETFQGLQPIIVHESLDGRNFVKKTVNWALRQIGKRNPALKQAAIKTAQGLGTPAGRWIAADALREITKTGKVTS
jgi:3-methyladenine DNA glycosylase AlkD